MLTTRIFIWFNWNKTFKILKSPLEQISCLKQRENLFMVGIRKTYSSCSNTILNTRTSQWVLDMFCQPSHSHFLVTLLFWHLMCNFQIHQKQDVKIKNIFQIPFSWREAPRQHLRQPRQDWLWSRRHQETVQGTGGQVSRRDDQRMMMMHCISSPWWWWHSDTVMIIGDPVVGGSGCGIFCFPEPFDHIPRCVREEGVSEQSDAVMTRLIFSH